MLTEKIPGPNPALIAVSRQAMQLVSRGQSLAVRHARYSAHSDFVRALRLIAQAYDAVSGGSRRSKQLAAGLLALREAEDFATDDEQRWAEQYGVRVIASGHGTPVVRESHRESDDVEVTPWEARQRYYTYAQKQLAAAVKGHPVASAALFSLGKLYVGHDYPGEQGEMLSSAHAMVYFQSALQVDSRNYTAANELGVLLAKMGQLNEARSVLRHAVTVRPDFAPTWNNLAVVHRRLGEIDLERRARVEFKRAQALAAGSAPADLGDSIRWVDPDVFARGTDAARPTRAAHRPSGEPVNREAERASWRFWN